MKKIGLAFGIVLICTAFCFFFLVGMNLPGEWWPHVVGAGLLIVGATLAIVSDRLNRGGEKRARQQEMRNESLRKQAVELNERLAREQAARNEILGSIHANTNANIYGDS